MCFSKCWTIHQSIFPHPHYLSETCQSLSLLFVLTPDMCSSFELPHHALSPGLCVVDGPHGGARRKLPVSLRHRHGRRSGDPVPRELGQLPAFPAAQRLPPFGLWVLAHYIQLVATLGFFMFAQRQTKDANISLPLFCTQITCATGSSTNTFRIFMLLWWLDMWIWWSPPSHSQFTKDLSESPGSL